MDDWIVSGEAATCYTNARNSRALRLPATAPDAKAGGYAPLGFLPAPHRPRVAALWPEFGRINSLRCACHEFRMLAQGHVDVMLSARLTPWDHTAGVLVVQQAGGTAKMLDGSVYSAVQ
jgi:fructose-1,6-bisphosphatase/inositol monophosphatase family enzyme